MVGKIAGMGLYSGLTIETTLDPTIQPFLHDHQIDGTPVLPGVMGIEAFAEAALCMLPGWHVEAIEEVNFLAPFKFYKNEPRTVTIQAVFYPQGEKLIADCRLIGRRALPNQPEPQVTTHFTARVRVRRSSLSQGGGRRQLRACRRKRSWKPRKSIAFTSTDPRTRFWNGHGGMEAHDRRLTAELARQSSAVGSAHTHGAAADRVVLPDRRALGDGVPGPHGPAAARAAVSSWIARSATRRKATSTRW